MFKVILFGEKMNYIEIKTKKFVLIFTIILLIISFQNSEAASVSVSPGSLNVDNMVREGYAERTVRIATSEEIANVRVVFAERDNEMNDWISLDPDSLDFEIGRNSPYHLTVRVEPPEDVPNGNYSTSLIFMIRGEDDPSGLTAAVIDTAVAFAIRVRITDDEVTACNVQQSRINSIEAGDDIISTFRIHNLGNIRMSPSIEIDIWNQEQSSLERTIFYNEDIILPTITREISFEERSRGLSPGQYFADVRIPECNFEQTLTFDILEPGTISSEGNLIGIRVPAWNNKSDTIVINPVFENTGERAVNAFFEGVIRLDGNIRARLETPTIQVNPGERTEFETFFSSEVPGRYEVSGRVYYDNKRTFERMNRFNILDQYSERRSLDQLQFSSGHAIIFIISAILALLIMIKKKEQKIRNNRL